MFKRFRVAYKPCESDVVQFSWCCSSLKLRSRNSGCNISLRLNKKGGGRSRSGREGRRRHGVVL